MAAVAAIMKQSSFGGNNQISQGNAMLSSTARNVVCWADTQSQKKGTISIRPYAGSNHGRSDGSMAAIPTITIHGCLDGNSQIGQDDTILSSTATSTPPYAASNHNRSSKQCIILYGTVAASVWSER
jgi:hypothetical protein